MSEKKISYLNRSFEDYKDSLMEMTQEYYPEIAGDFNDSSIGSWMVDIVAAVADNLSFYIDKAYNETNIESAQSMSSILSIARSNGFHVPGPKGSIVEVKFTAKMPVTSSMPNSVSTLGMPNWAYAPIIRKGTRLKSSSGVYFETDYDINFAEGFSPSGVSDREIIPVADSNNVIQYYLVSKLCTATAGVSKVYKAVLTSSQIKPFMEVILPEREIMNVESVILKDDANTSDSIPDNDEFYNQNEFVPAASSVSGVDTYRFFEVESLLQQYLWGDDISTLDANQIEAKPSTYLFGYTVEKTVYKFKVAGTQGAKTTTTYVLQSGETINSGYVGYTLCNTQTGRCSKIDSIVLDGTKYECNGVISTVSGSSSEVITENTIGPADAGTEFEVRISVEVPVWSVTRGQWNPIGNKFITEYTDKGYLKLIFGSGEQAGQDLGVYKANNKNNLRMANLLKSTGLSTSSVSSLLSNDSGMDLFTKNRMSKMIRNNFLGRLPKAGLTMYVKYRTGGGAISNVAANTITTIVSLDAITPTCPLNNSDKKIMAKIRESITVNNPIASVSGKDAPSVDEIRNMIKYNNASQNRCVTVKDYEIMVQKMPPRYGCPFRVAAIEENNKIMLYLLSTDSNGKLTGELPSAMTDNIQNFLSMYRTVNDYVEIKGGRVVNVSFEADLYINKNYDSESVIKNVINVISEYMDINKHALGEDIYVSDIEKEVSLVDGVISIIDFRVFNEYGEGYSETRISQTTTYVSDDESKGEETSGRSEIDLDASDYILNSDADEMFEIKYPDADINIRAKSR